MAVASLLITLVLASDSASLSDAEAAFRAGLAAQENPAEARRCFREAAKGYEALGHDGACNVPLFRNLGNAYLLAGDLPHAILSYRRGLQLNPCDRGLRTNLTAARSQVVYSESPGFDHPAPDPLPEWLPYVDPYLRLLFAVLFAAMGALAVARWWMLGGEAMVGLGFVCLAAAVLLTATLVFEDWANRRDREHPVVVIAEDGVLLRHGNGLSYPRRYETALHRGVEARLIVARGNWLQIELPGGQLGWIPRAYALVLRREK